MLCMSKTSRDIKTIPSNSRCILKHVEDVKDRSNTHKGCNAMYVEDVEDIKTSHNRCILKYVEDVEDRSNTPKGCNAMYVKDVEDGIKNIATHILAHNFLKYCQWIDQIRKKGCNGMYAEDVESYSNHTINICMYVKACRRCQR